ncbi:MAG: transcription elongation factor GreA [Candidatus Cloacimonetes bacterium]|nr:transcription elongation factor GreA [Candidatus Cloacimonadota bacterium]
MSDFNYITKQGLIRLQERMNHLNLVERPEVVQQVVTAREMGDLSENAEYHAARERQRHIDKEISYIRSRLAKLKVVDPAQVPKDAVRFGAIVRIRDENTSEELVYQLLGVDETEGFSTEGVTPLSIASPIGKYLTGKKVGETTVIRVPSGEKTFKVLEIK